jgi:erythromycin esterase
VAEEITLKHQVLRLLVERLGFRSVAWEDDWTLGQEINDYLLTGAGSVEALVGRMGPQWQSREVADVLRWLRAFNTGRPDSVRFVGVEYYLTRASVAFWEHHSLPVFALDLRRPAPPAVRAWLAAPATFRGVADRGDAGFLDGGSPTQWFDLVVFHRTATPAGMP